MAQKIYRIFLYIRKDDVLDWETFLTEIDRDSRFNSLRQKIYKKTIINGEEKKIESSRLNPAVAIMKLIKIYNSKRLRKLEDKVEN